MTRKEQFDSIDEETKVKLEELCGLLSPERLSCDGELSRSEIRAKIKVLSKQWVAIEKELGFSFEPDEFEDYTEKLGEFKEVTFNDNNRYSQPDLSVATIWPMLKNYKTFNIYEEDYQNAIIREDNRLLWLQSERNRLSLTA
jgi:hypothetical protein